MSENSPLDATPDVPSLEQMMQVLSDDQRRETLTYLFERDGERPIAVETLAEHVTDADETYEQTYKLLHHSHLPRLDAAGIVAYDRTDERVRLAGDQSSVEKLLEASRRVD